MQYYEWLGELDAVEIEFPDRQFNGYWMVEGEEVVGWNRRMIAVYECDHVPQFDFGMACNGWPIFSSRMMELLDNEVPQAVQFLPFRFQRLDGTDQVAGFHVGQILNRADCLDRSSCKVRKDWQPVNAFGDFDLYRPLFLAQRLIADTKLFRIQGHSLSIVIREDLKVAIEAAGFQNQRMDLIESH